MTTLCDIANRTLFVIGVSGSGKSTAYKWLKKNVKRQIVDLHSVGISTLAKFGNTLQSNPTTILIEDLSVAKTEDMMIKTAFFITHLTYDKRLIRIIMPYPIEIHNFVGSAIINFQPYILEAMFKQREWETDIRDKAIRYYHLYLPLEQFIKPPSELPTYRVKYSYVDEVSFSFDIKSEWLSIYRKALQNFRHEFTEARAREHLNALLKANAILNERNKLTKADLIIIERLSRIFKLELEIFEKEHLEGKRTLNVDLLPILSVLATYSSYPISKLMLHFQVRRSQIYNILNTLSEYVLTYNSPSRIIPTDYTKQLLKEIGVR